MNKVNGNNNKSLRQPITCLKKVSTTSNDEYSWIILLILFLHEGRFKGIPGGIRPQICSSISTKIPLDLFKKDRSFMSTLAISAY